MPPPFPPFKLVTAAALLLAASACASSEKDPDKEDLEANADNSDGDLSKPAKAPASTSDEVNNNASDQSQSDDGYDDDWNNMGSQVKKNAQNNANNNNQSQTDEPAIVNEKKEEPPPEQPVAEAPPANPVPEPNPASEPPPDAEPAPVAQEPPASTRPPAPDVKPVISGAPLIRQDLKPVSAELVWVGFDYLEKDSVVKIELVTRGTPKFNLFQERNKSDQPELVVRFFQTKLRDKVRRDINASEFRSPVAFVRMRYDEEENAVDVVMTMRDPVQPRMYAKGGNVLLTFPVPDHYFGNSVIGGAPVARAEVLANTNVMPEFDTDSDATEGMKIARAFINNPGGDAFKGAPADGGKPVNAVPAPEPEPINPGNNVLPADFTNTPPQNPAPANAPPVNTGDQNLNTGGNVEDLDFSPDGGPPVDGEPLPGGNGENVNTEGGNNDDDSQENDNDNDDDDPIEDGDTGDGDSSQEIDKFDVRAKGRTGGWIVTLNKEISATHAAPSLHLSACAARTAAPAAEQTRSPARILAALDHPWTARVVRVALISAAFFSSASEALAAGPRPDASDKAFSIAGVAQDDGGLDEGGADPGADSGGANAPNNAAGGSNPVANAGVNAGGNTPPLANNTTAGGNPVNTSAFGNTTANPAANATGKNAATGNTAPANPAPVNPVSNAPAPDNGGAASGEPPVATGADLSGQEQQGNDNAEAPQPSSGGRPIRLDFRGARLTEVIRALGEESGVNFVLAAEVSDKLVNINFNNVPFNDALRALLDANALGMVEAGPNIVRIDSLANLAKDKTDLESRRKAEIRLRPTKVLVQRLSYAKADKAVNMLQSLLKGATTDDNRVSVQTDERTNSVIVNAPPNDLSMVKALLERIDLETPQVKITTRIVEILKKFGNEFGISWGGPLNFDQGRGLGFGNLNFPNYARSRFAIDPGGPKDPAINMNFNFGSLNKLVDLDLALKMAESHGTTEVLQSGDIIVEDQFKAIITAGAEDQFRKTSAVTAPVAAPGAAAPAGGSDFDVVKYDLTMDVTPHVTVSGAVSMEVNITNTSPTKPIAEGAPIGTYHREVHTKLLRQSGETAAVGGIFTTDRGRTNNGVPFLSSLPIIGALFRSTSQNETKRELLVMLTPTILHGAKTEGGGSSSSEDETGGNNGNVALNNNNGGGGNNNGGANNAAFGNNNAGGAEALDASASEDNEQSGGGGANDNGGNNNNGGGNNNNAGGSGNNNNAGGGGNDNAGGGDDEE